MARMRTLRAFTLIGYASPFLHVHANSFVSPASPLFQNQQCSLHSNDGFGHGQGDDNVPIFSQANQKTTTTIYRVAAAYSSKRRRFNPQEDYYVFDPWSKDSVLEGDGNGAKGGLGGISGVRPNSGQDAFFVAASGQSSNSTTVAFGVADGVGGWDDHGIDSADMSHTLCKNMKILANSVPDGKENSLQPRDLLDRAFTNLKQGNMVEGGGTTACLAVGRPDGTVEAANLGDSGFVHLRPKEIAFESPAQTKGFNTPFQLSIIPEEMRVRQRIFGGGDFIMDSPKDADVTSHKVSHGDILVFATDGVWDNLSPKEIYDSTETVLNKYGAWPLSKQNNDLGALTMSGTTSQTRADQLQAALAIEIAGRAKVASLDRRRNGPFAIAAAKQWSKSNAWQGGKPDDICVVVAVVLEI